MMQSVRWRLCGEPNTEPRPFTLARLRLFNNALTFSQCRQLAAQSLSEAQSLTACRILQLSTLPHTTLSSLHNDHTEVLLRQSALCYLLTSGSLSAAPPLLLPPAACPSSTSANEGALKHNAAHNPMSASCTNMAVLQSFQHIPHDVSVACKPSRQSTELIEAHAEKKYLQRLLFAPV